MRGGDRRAIPAAAVLGRDADRREAAHRHPPAAEELAELSDARARHRFAPSNTRSTRSSGRAGREAFEIGDVPTEGAAQHLPDAAQLVFVAVGVRSSGTIDAARYGSARIDFTGFRCQHFRDYDGARGPARTAGPPPYVARAPSVLARPPSRRPAGGFFVAAVADAARSPPTHVPPTTTGRRTRWTTSSSSTRPCATASSPRASRSTSPRSSRSPTSSPASASTSSKPGSRSRRRVTSNRSRRSPKRSTGR